MTLLLPKYSSQIFARLDQLTEFHDVSADSRLVILKPSLPERLEHGAPVACADPARL